MGNVSNTGGRCAEASAAPVLSANRTCRSIPPPNRALCPGLSLLRDPCSSQPEQPNKTTGVGSIRSTTRLKLVSPCLREPMVLLHKATASHAAMQAEVQTGYTKIQRLCTYFYWISSRMSKSSGSSSSFIRVLSVVLLVKAMQHNLFNLLGICAINIFLYI